MCDEVPDRSRPVGPDDGDVDAGDPAVDEDHRGAAQGDVPQERGAAVGGRDEEAVDPAVDERADVVVLEVGPLVGVADDDAVAEGAGLLLDEAGQLGEVRVEHVADDQAERAGLGGAQRSGHRVGPVAEGLDGGEDAGTRLLADGRMAVQHTRHRGDGHPRLGRDILDARHVRTTSLCFPYTSKPGSRPVGTGPRRRGIDYTDDWNRLHGSKQDPSRGRYLIVTGEVGVTGGVRCVMGRCTA